MKLRFSDVPLWLHDSEFYRSWNGNAGSDTPSEIPSEFFPAANDSVRTAEDLAAILKVMNFWGVAHIPDSVLQFCHVHSASSWNSVYAEIAGEESTEYKAVTMAFEQPQCFTLEKALATNRPKFVTFWLAQNDANSEHSKNAIAQACRFGRLDLVKTLREKGFKCTWDSNAYGAAAQYGHLHILKYLHMSKCPLRKQNDALVYAARGGQLECMKYLRSIGCPWDQNVTIEYAVPSHYKHLQHNASNTLTPWTDDFTILPPVDGYIECLRYALDNGCIIHREASNRAAEYGLLDCLQLLRKHGAVWDTYTSAAASAGGHIDVMQYLLHSECSWNSTAPTAAVRNGHFAALVYLHEIGCPWDETATAAAVAGGHTKCVDYLREQGCP